MTDDASQQDDEPVDDSTADVDNSTKTTEVPPGMLPLVPPVFGKWAFAITALPFLIYLAGTGFGAHLENIRKTKPAHDMRGVCGNLGKVLADSVKSIPPEQQAKLREDIDIKAVMTVFEDENSTVTTLVQRCQKMIDADLSEYPEGVAKSVGNFSDYVEHWLKLKDYEEENDYDSIIPEHTAFVELHPDDPNLKLPSLNKSWYPTLYSVACLSALLVVLCAMPGYLKIPFRISGLAVGVGVVGVIVWIGLWWIDKHYLGIGAYFAPNARAGFNPFEELKDNPTWMWTFLAIRLIGLVLVIPIAEEFFSRGFLIRYIEDIDWDQIPLGEATWKGWAGILVYGAATHPGEIVAALAWFGLIMWMYLKTKNIWDCVIAHIVTNGLLAAFVLYTKTWELW